MSLPVRTLLLSLAVLAVLPDEAPAQYRGTTREITGTILPMQISAMTPGRRARMALMNSMVKCDPSETSPGASPSSFFLDTNRPGGPQFSWPEVVGAVAYVVDRAVDGTSNWTLAGTTCGSPHDIGRLASGRDSYAMAFEDISGGVVPGTSYVYRIKALGPKGELGWNSVRWTAPVPTVPVWGVPVITGSTATLKFSMPQSNTYMADEWILTAPDGRRWNGYFALPGYEVTAQVLGLQPGTYTFTLTAQWVQAWDPNMPRVTATSTTQTSVTIKI